jgi:opacity protein-like surface antigen
MFTFLARAGYLLKPNLLLYVLGGGAEGNFVIPSDDDFFGEDQSTWVLGYTVGAGLEYKINSHWSLRGEYRFVNFEVNRNGSTSLQESADPEGPNNNVSTNTNTNSSSKTDFNFNMGKIGVVYQFDPAKK